MIYCRNLYLVLKTMMIIIFSFFVGIVSAREEAPRVDIVTKAEVFIAAEPEIIWPYLNKKSLWLEGISSEKNVTGIPGSLGEIVRISKKGEGVPATLSKTIKKIENRLLVLRLYPEKEGIKGYDFLSYNVYRLKPEKNGTRLSLEKYMDWGRSDLSNLSSEDLHQKELMLRNSIQDWFQGGLKKIKQLVESPQVPSQQ